MVYHLPQLRQYDVRAVNHSAGPSAERFPHAPFRGGVYLGSGLPAVTRESMRDRRQQGMDLLKAAQRFTDRKQFDKAAALRSQGGKYVAETAVSHYRFDKEQWTEEQLAHHVAHDGLVMGFKDFSEPLRRMMMYQRPGLQMHFDTHLSRMDALAFSSFAQVIANRYGLQQETMNGDYVGMMPVNSPRFGVWYSNWEDGKSSVLLDTENAEFAVDFGENYLDRKWRG